MGDTSGFLKGPDKCCFQPIGNLFLAGRRGKIGIMVQRAELHLQKSKLPGIVTEAQILGPYVFKSAVVLPIEVSIIALMVKEIEIGHTGGKVDAPPEYIVIIYPIACLGIKGIARERPRDGVIDLSFQ